MIAAIAPLLLAAQVGPNPSPMVLEPLPIPRDSKADDAQPAPADFTEQAIAWTVEGNRAIIAGNAEAALQHLDLAREYARAAGEAAMLVDIDLDRARALLMLDRNDEASALLDDLRQRSPANADAWLFSAIAARRLDDLAKAQALIEEAATFAPANPGVGLEGGLIAWVAGRQDAAIASWQSVIEIAPGSDEAEIARQYIESAGVTPPPDRNEGIVGR